MGGYNGKDMAAHETKYAPIAIFAYNRPVHLQRTVEALLCNPEAAESEVFFFSDGPRNESVTPSVEAVRTYLRQLGGFGRITIVERDRNLGLANSIIEGVTQICATHGRVIVLEDDLVTSPYFLSYMNDGLSYYAEDERVISIHAYTFPVDPPVPPTFFLKGAGCLGWATWKERWGWFEHNGQILMDNLQKSGLQKAFDYEGGYSYSRMLAEQIQGKNSSWAIRWHASAFLKNKLTLHPGESLVVHIGNDGSGTHYGVDDFMGDRISSEPITVGNIPVVHNQVMYAKYVEYFKRYKKPFTGRLKSHAHGILRRLTRIAN